MFRWSRSTEEGHIHGGSCYTHIHPTHMITKQCSGSTRNGKQHACFYTHEYIANPAYGLNVSYLYATKDQNGRVIPDPLWDSPSLLAGRNSFTTVGFTIPHSYYLDKNVIKAYGSQKTSMTNQAPYILPTINGKPTTASAYAVFDVLFSRSKDQYYLRFYNNISEVKYQSSGDFALKYKTLDYTNAITDTDFSYMDNNNSINGVKFIAHRDLLSGDDVTSSLAVSGYMAKYAQNSNTADYLGFMSDAGFAFQGLSGVTTDTSKTTSHSKLSYTDDANHIGHAQRTIWIANADIGSGLAPSTNGTGDTYNTNYTQGGNDETKVRFGLGGATSDTADLYGKYISNSVELKDSSLNEATEKGDALRSIYYYAQEKQSAVGTTCNNYWDASVHTASCGHDSKSCNGHSPATHSLVDVRPYWTSVSNNAYVCVHGDKNLTNGIYSGENVFDEKQTDMISKIETSRTQFNVPLAVEGTTAGMYGDSGITYAATDSDGDALEDIELRLINNILTLEYTDEDLENAWRNNVFEIKSAKYADVGEINPGKSSLLAEYRYTIPTQNYVFNPSYYMLYDDSFENVNKSVWMLSEQPRELNFRDILSIRLHQDRDADDAGEGAKNGYPTAVNSEWSTDFEDADETLPTAKAANAYTTDTTTQTGTITAYVVLQDPDFTGNPTETQKANEAKLKAYNEQMKAILDAFTTTNNTALTDISTTPNAFGAAMYTNMVNGSSVNSSFRVTDTAGGEALLPDKEPMKFSDSVKFDYEVTTGDHTNNKVDEDNWTYYALAGYEVLPFNSSELGEGYENKETDISDTTANRKFNGKPITSSDDATGDGVKTTLAELNDQLCALMVEPWNIKGEDDEEHLAYPSNTTPFLNGGNFDWYSEDYEGFIVAVYQISFEISDDNLKDSGSLKDNSKHTTDVAAIYRSESDWRTERNELATEEGHTLAVPESYKVNGVEAFINNGNLLADDGEITLITRGSKDYLKNGIYGIGLELANLPIWFGYANNNFGNAIIGSEDTTRSFFYQPTYFNIRGSVYDTAR